MHRVSGFEQVSSPLQIEDVNVLGQSAAAMQGGIFGIVGLGAGLVGTCMSNSLIAIRKTLDPEFEPQNALPNVPLNAACKQWDYNSMLTLDHP